MFKKAIKHFCLVLRHKWGVFKNCVRCGLIWRGLVHDTSKFSPTEFFESVKYYNGSRSPISVCRKTVGYSKAWLHHKGRNKHHIEYWYDEECEVQPLMPYKYAVECVCDKLSATKTYKGKDYSPEMPLLHWDRYGSRACKNEQMKLFFETVFTDLKDKGEKYILNKRYMKATYERVCK